MTSMSMPVLPDCTRCGASVVLVIDGDGAREECVSCGLSQKPMPPRRDRQEVRSQARQVVEQARREGLPVMRCPSCKQDRHDRCHASGCECVKGEHPRRPVELYHYTCDHGAKAIERQRWLVGNAHPLLPFAGPLVHLTNLDTPERDALGLTSYSLSCDRTEYRVTVRTNTAEHWPVFARSLPRVARERFEDCPGARPAHWWVSRMPVAVLEVARVA